MKRTLLLWLSILCCLLTGCQKQTQPPQSRIVTNVTVAYNEDMLGQYHTEQKIQSLLLYLRGLELPRLNFGRQDLTVPLRHVFTLELTFADGHTKRYQQANHRFVRINNGPWCEVSSERCAELYHVLLAYPPDTPPEPVFHRFAVDLPQKLCYTNGKFASAGGRL